MGYLQLSRCARDTFGLLVDEEYIFIAELFGDLILRPSVGRAGVTPGTGLVPLDSSDVNLDKRPNGSTPAGCSHRMASAGSGMKTVAILMVR